MRKLYLKIYLTFLAVVFICIVVAVGAARLLFETYGEVPPPVRSAIEVLADDIEVLNDPTSTARGEDRKTQL